MSRKKNTVFRIGVSVVAIAVVGVGALVCVAQFRFRAAQTGESVSFEHDGVEREYRIHVPEKIPPGQDVPLVVCLHGGGGNSRTASMMGLTPVADREGFIVVYPNAIDKHWNDGRDSPMYAEHDEAIDDVAFVMEVIRRVGEEHAIDRNRIFATGLSNGGFMTQRLAIEHSETFAAVGVVIATMGEPISERFVPKLPVSVLYLNGTKDTFVPYEGGPVGMPLVHRFNQVEGHEDAPRGRAISTDDAVLKWVTRNQTDTEPIVKRLADTDKEDGSYIESSLWDNGERGTAVMLYKVVGGGHGLPGGSQYLPARLIGYANQDVDGFDLIWDFFQNHARIPVAVGDEPNPGVAPAVPGVDSSSTQKPPSVFPGDTWQTVDPETIGVDAKALDAALDFGMRRQSSSIVIVVGGKVVAQRHAAVTSPGLAYRRALQGVTDEGHALEDVASVQKSITSILMGIALSRGLLQLDDPVDQYLGKGWSKTASEQESAITLRHLITMTTGLDERLNFRSPPGTQWKYNTKAYQLTMDVIVEVAGMSRAELTRRWLTDPLKMHESEWVARQSILGSTNSHGFVTSALDLARVGLLILNHGQWDGRDIVNNKAYLSAATSPSQALNPSYGYLWWLNGQQFVIHPSKGKLPRPLIENAPSDLVAAEGMLGRKLHVVPSMQLIVTRLGDSPEVRGEAGFDDEFWRLLMKAF
ncbi:serine hydrolase [Aporhodopirellula aestuarii]|uniref:Serine hydrolase n=1 Tax=Aporhodopirellula aestuarii TaxID=2950107 RepID=A0ABT0TXK6_9BACT|nr:serine hydrolase [Aporhodopirellula aestuarii]MCM2369315.1 serine hydrolase [Aporhodopirellula aestuarii]